MKRMLTFAATVAVFASITVVTAVTFAQRGDSPASPAKDSRQTSEAPGVSAMCVQDHPDCNDMIVGGTGGGPANTCTKDNPDCNDTSLGGGGTIDSGPSGGSGSAPSAGVTYDITVPFDSSVTDDDTKLANDIVLAFDPNASFLLQESFPPTGRATVATTVADFCAAIESKLAGVPSVSAVTCAASANVNPPCCKPDAPISSTPGSEPGVNPLAPDSPPAGE